MIGFRAGRAHRLTAVSAFAGNSHAQRVAVLELSTVIMINLSGATCRVAAAQSSKTRTDSGGPEFFQAFLRPSPAPSYVTTFTFTMPSEETKVSFW